jgi:hypothetical protein
MTSLAIGLWPRWLRVAIVGIVTAAAIGGGWFCYHYFAKPIYLTVAAGSVDGEALALISAQAAAPSTDADALISIHPGAATYYNGNQQSFLDKYDDKLYYGSLLLGSLVSIIIAAWRFAGSRIAPQSTLEPLYELGNEIKGAGSEAELEEIEKRIDAMLKAELARNANGEGADSADMAALGLAAHRLQYLMSHRRTLLRGESARAEAVQTK